MNSDSGKDGIINYKSGKGVNIAARKRKRPKLHESERNSCLRVDVHNYKFQSVKERSRQLLNERQRAEQRKGLILIGDVGNKRQSAFICVDVDAFYAQTLLLKEENKCYKNKPFAVTQKHIVVTCNYPARKLGIKKLQLISEAKDKCPHLILQSGEDLTPFRRASNEIYHATKNFFLDYRSKISSEFRSDDNDAEDVQEVAIMKSGLDEIFIDVTMLASFVNDHVVANEIAYMASINDNTCHLLEGAFSQSAHNNRILLCAHNIALELRRYIFRKLGFETCAGVASNKMAAKLAVNMHKPNQQTTILKEAILPVMLDLPVNKITGIGRVLVKRLNVELGIFFVKDALHEKFSMSKLCALFGSRVGRFLFLAFRGIDEAEVKDQVAPKSIAIEDSMLGVSTKTEVYMYLEALCQDLHARLVEDKSLYNRKPTSLCLKIREKGAGYGNRISKSVGLPVVVDCPDDLVLVSKKLFDKLILDVTNKHCWVLTLIGLSCSCFESASCVKAQRISSFFSAPKKDGTEGRKVELTKLHNQSDLKGNSRAKAHGATNFKCSTSSISTSDFEVLPKTIDKIVFQQLPSSIQQEILQSIKFSQRNEFSKSRSSYAGPTSSNKKRRMTKSIKSYFLKK